MRGDPTFLQQRIVAVPVDLGEVALGLGLLQRRFQLCERAFGLRDLMIELGRRDLYQQISGFDLAADIDVALGDVAARARKCWLARKLPWCPAT